MAESKNTQTAPALLPEPDTFTLEEIAERWTRLTGQAVTPRHIVNYRNQGLVELFDVRSSHPPSMNPFASLSDIVKHWEAHGWPTPPTEDDLRMTIEERDLFEQAHGIGKPTNTTAPDTAEPTPSTDRPWAHLIDSPNPKKSGLYKQDAGRIRGSLTPEGRRMWAREAVERNNGNNTEAGLELGVTPQRIGQLLQ